MIVDTPTNSLLLRLRQPELVRKVMPKWSKDVDYQGHNIAVKFDLDVVRVLRNMGIKAPSPIRYNYNWPRPGRFKSVFNHQIATAEFLTFHQRAFVLNEMGTSKTASALWAADYMMLHGYVGKVVIVSPLSTLDMVWADEIFSCLMHRSFVVLHGTREKRMQLLDSDADFYIINHDGLKIIADELKRRKDISLIIVDEAAAYRNGTTTRYKTLKDLIQPWHRLWLMTGTPCPNSPLDAWALARLVDPTRVPQWYGQWKRETMVQLTQYKWVPRPGSHETAFAAMQPAVRFKKADCIDLPPVTYENRACAITPAQAASLREMKREAATLLSNGVQITAANAADKIGKMRQILCGSVKDPLTGDYHALDYTPRLSLLLECIEQAAAKVLVIVPYKGILYQLKDDIEHAWVMDGSPWKCDFVNGDVSRVQRTTKFATFKTDPDHKILLCHPRVMAHGITATEADMVIFYGPINSNEESQQVMERINRPGQTHKMTIIRMGASNLEWNIYDQVEGKRQTQESMLELYKKELLSL